MKLNFFFKRPYLLFIAPAFIILLVFSVFSIFVAIAISFTNMDLMGLLNWDQVHFIGLDNYKELLRDGEFIQAILNTLFYVVFGVPLVVVLSLGVALLLDYGKNKIFTAARTMFYIPSVTTSVAVAVVWGFLYNTHYGLFNYVLSLLHIPGVPWLTHPVMAKISLILLAAWKAIGLNMIIFLAALQGIPKDYYEAAEIDGATRWQKLIFIKVPLLKFATFFVATTTIIGWFQFFEEPMIMTEGGPLGSSNSIALFIYDHGFKLSEFGYAAAGSVILFAIILIVTLIQFKMRKQDNGHY
ncbi:sugar ABC transporter permease [Bacillaceae bacterium Marseille-Q3522]|nr:sugar ABC transporter permease [Bacillaceae bacterium Marseille-Q3522]